MEVEKSPSRFSRMSSTGSADDASSIDEELEVLEAIYIHELKVIHDDSNRPKTIQLLLHPSTEDDHDKQYVCLTLIFEPTLEYPHESPVIKIRNPRGLADDEIESLSRRLDEHAEANKGIPMLFGLIEIAKDVLTDSNVPHCPCVICLEHFTEEDTISRTECYHYFHPGCLSRLIKFSLEDTDRKESSKTLYNQKEEKKVLCPVCRDVIRFDVELLDIRAKEAVQAINYKPDPEMVQMQKKMSALYLQQKAKGAIIDVEAEKNKYLVPADGMVYGLQLPRKEEEKDETAQTKKTGKDKQKNSRSGQDSARSGRNESTRSGRNESTRSGRNKSTRSEQNESTKIQFVKKDKEMDRKQFDSNRRDPENSKPDRETDRKRFDNRQKGPDNSKSDQRKRDTDRKHHDGGKCVTDVKKDSRSAFDERKTKRGDDERSLRSGSSGYASGQGTSHRDGLSKCSESNGEQNSVDGCALKRGASPRDGQNSYNERKGERRPTFDHDSGKLANSLEDKKEHESKGYRDGHNHSDRAKPSREDKRTDECKGYRDGHHSDRVGTGRDDKKIAQSERNGREFYQAGRGRSRPGRGRGRRVENVDFAESFRRDVRDPGTIEHSRAQFGAHDHDGRDSASSRRGRGRYGDLNVNKTERNARETGMNEHSRAQFGTHNDDGRERTASRRGRGRYGDLNANKIERNPSSDFDERRSGQSQMRHYDEYHSKEREDCSRVNNRNSSQNNHDRVFYDKTKRSDWDDQRVKGERSDRGGRDREGQRGNEFAGEESDKRRYRNEDRYRSDDDDFGKGRKGIEKSGSGGRNNAKDYSSIQKYADEDRYKDKEDDIVSGTGVKRGGPGWRYNARDDSGRTKYADEDRYKNKEDDIVSGKGVERGGCGRRYDAKDDPGRRRYVNEDRFRDKEEDFGTGKGVERSGSGKGYNVNGARESTGTRRTEFEAKGRYDSDDAYNGHNHFIDKGRGRCHGRGRGRGRGRARSSDQVDQCKSACSENKTGNFESSFEARS